MGKKRVYEIAKDEGLPSANVLHRLQRGGMGVKTASSTVDVDWALLAGDDAMRAAVRHSVRVRRPADREA